MINNINSHNKIIEPSETFAKQLKNWERFRSR